MLILAFPYRVPLFLILHVLGDLITHRCLRKSMLLHISIGDEHISFSIATTKPSLAHIQRNIHISIALIS